MGALVGGAALALGGFALLGVAFGGLFLASTLPYAAIGLSRRRGGSLSLETRALRLKHGPTLLVRPLRHGDVETVAAVFERLGERSRHTRFNGPKPRLTAAELDHLAAVDATRQVLVGYLEGDKRPVAIAPRSRRRKRRDRVRGGRRAPPARHRFGVDGGAARRRPRGGNHGDHGPRRERQLGGGQPPAPGA
jgi:hypothetical protein